MSKSEKPSCLKKGEVLGEARNMTKARPLAVVTDGLGAYQHATTKEFSGVKENEVERKTSFTATFRIFVHVTL
jgi:hypothetical protein